VLTVAAVNVGLGLVASEAAARRDDDRTFLVSMALLASAGFLGLHALATPGILLDDISAGFSVAARVGLLLAAGFAAISALDSDTRVVRVLAGHRRLVRTVLGLVLAAWAIASLARVPLLDRPLPPDTVPPPLGLLALVGVALFGFAAVRYAELYRRRRRPLPLAVLVAFILSTLRRIDRRDAERLAEVVGTIRS
jgi:adenylate cyclase